MLEQKNNKGYIVIGFGVQRENGTHITLGTWVAIDSNTNIQDYINHIINQFNIKDSTYADTGYVKIFIRLNHRTGLAPDSRKFINGKLASPLKKSDLTVFQHYRLPGFIHPDNMGTVIDSWTKDDKTTYWVELEGGRKCVVEQIINKDGFIESTIKLYKDGNVVLIANDVQTSEDRFTRTITSGKSQKVWVYSMEGKKLLFYTDVNTKFIEAANADPKLTNKIIAFDMETREICVSGKTILEPFLACFVVNTNAGFISKSFFLSDYN